MGREEVQATFPVVGVESRSARGRPVEPAPVHDHHDFLRGLPAGCPHLLDILAQLLRLTVRDALREALGGAILDGPNDAEHHAPGNTAPGALRPHACRVRAASRVSWLGRRGRLGRRARGAGRHQPARGSAKRHRTGASASSPMLSPRRA